MDELGILENAEETATIVRNFAIIGAVYEDGVSLIFDGETDPTEKHYLCNTNVYFSPGDRVRILEDSGTYIVEYVVGSPKRNRTVGLPPGGSAGQVLTKDTTTDGDASWKAARQSSRAVGVQNQYSSTTQGSNDYRIQFRTNGTYGTGAKTFQIRMGTGSWFTLSTT